MKDTYSGHVVSFDDHRGRGEVEADSGELRYPFHCTAIDDGSRTVAVGSAVEFDLVIGPLGQPEAAAIRSREG
jgi:cold shock CspA family protein